MSFYDEVDCSLNGMPEPYDAEIIKELEAHTLNLKFSPTIVNDRINNFFKTINLDWVQKRITDFNVSDLPDKTGVYAFSIMLESDNFPCNNYILYFGETDQQNIQKRLGQYKQISRLQRRPSIYKMMKLWREYLYFSYAIVDGPPAKIKEIEENLNDIFMPPYSLRDYSATVRNNKSYDAYGK